MLGRLADGMIYIEVDERLFGVLIQRFLFLQCACRLLGSWTKG